MKRIFLVDIVWQGHVPTYHKQYISSLVRLGHEVVSVSPNPSDVSNWLDINIPEQKENVHCISFTHTDANEGNSSVGANSSVTLFVLRKLSLYRFAKPFQLFFSGIKMWGKVNTTIKSHEKENKSDKQTFVFFPYLDYLFYNKRITFKMVDSLFQYNWAGLYLHPTQLRLNRNNKTPYSKSIFHSPNCKGVALLDENVLDRFQALVKKKTVRFPDITDEKNAPITTDCENILKIANGRKIISLVGGISIKKNLILLLKAAQIAEQKGLPYFFLIAGPIDMLSWDNKEQLFIKDFLENKQSNIYFYSKNIPDGIEYNSFVKISDIIYAVYNLFYHSSNTLTKAAIFEKLIIVKQGYLMAERVIKYDTGLAISAENETDILKAIDCLLKGVSYEGVKLSPRFKEYAEMHSLKYLNLAFEEILT